MIKIIIEGEEYTEKQYQKDLIRLFDSLREKDNENRGELNCNGFYCSDCPLQNICFNSGWGYTYISYDYIEAVYKWSKEHPIKTNRDVLKKTFDNDICTRIFELDWFDQEYKEPKGENKNG